jgi:hypothetical protein
LRTLYPLRKIVIIDDNSNYDFVKPDYDYNNIEIIRSEFKGRGELLPYYYYLKTKFFENAIIIHDSVFFHAKIDFDMLNVKVLPLWFFYPDKENLGNTIRLSNSLTNSFNIQNKLSQSDTVLGLTHLKWFGCFGGQSYINHGFLCDIEKKYHITNLINVVRNRNDRCCLERILGVIFFTEYDKIVGKKSLLGDIMKYTKWGYSYSEYEKDLKKGKLPKIIIKIWTGR